MNTADHSNVAGAVEWLQMHMFTTVTLGSMAVPLLPCLLIDFIDFLIDFNST